MVAEPSPLPSCIRGLPSRSSVEGGTPGGGVLVPVSIRGEVGCRRKSSAVSLDVPQFARTLKATEAAVRAGVKVRVLLEVLMAVMVRGTPSLLYSSFWLVE